MQSKGIVEVIGEHSSYWELFAGSLAVLLAKPRSRAEVVVDLNCRATNLALVMQDDVLSTALFDRLVRTVFCDKVYERSCERLAEIDEAPRGPSLEMAYDYFVASWMGRNGLVGTTRELTSGFCKRFSSSGGDPAVRFRNAVDSIPEWWQRLRGVTILNDDAFAIVDRIKDQAGTVVYADPPYLSKGVEYRHDFSDAMHLRLAERLRRFQKAKLIVSYYDDPSLDTLYVEHGFSKIRVTTTKQMGNGKREAPEVLLVKNG